MGQVVSWVGLGKKVPVDSKMARRVADRDEEDRQGSPGTEPSTVKERVGAFVVVVVVVVKII